LKVGRYLNYPDASRDFPQYLHTYVGAVPLIRPQPFLFIKLQFLIYSLQWRNSVNQVKNC
jgi:hypothetical protein